MSRSTAFERPSSVFSTKRLEIRASRASKEDAAFLHRLWTTPEVMVNVGFPRGLQITEADVLEQLRSQPEGEFDIRLLVMLRETGEVIGEAKLGRPDPDGISETDVKLLPRFWGRGFGTEIKQGLVDYLFTHTDCRIVKATPNQNNLASQRMQEAVGGKRVGSGCFRFPEEMRSYTCDVRYYEYQVTREDWQRRQAG